MLEKLGRHDALLDHHVAMRNGGAIVRTCGACGNVKAWMPRVAVGYAW